MSSLLDSDLNRENMKHGMKVLRLLMCTMCIVMMHCASAQQHPIFTQYMFNGLVINPAYAGSHESMSLTATARRQWAGLAGAPETEIISMHTPLKFSRSAAGIVAIHDQVSVMNQTTLYGVYSYRIPISEKAKLAVGAQGGVTYYHADYTQLDIVTGTSQTDPAFAGIENRYLPNLGIGAYYYTKRTYVGLSLPTIINNRWSNQDAELKARQQRQYFLSAGHVFDLSQDLKLKPNILLRWVESGPFQYDINANLLIKEIVWVGVSYRMKDAIDGLIEFNINRQLSIGYSYGYPISKLVAYQSGTHEVLVSYRLKRNKDIMLSPRYF
jgi:type IX secretion system PorP/SprF family membrane protein